MSERPHRPDDQDSEHVPDTVNALPALGQPPGSRVQLRDPLEQPTLPDPRSACGELPPQPSDSPGRYQLLCEIARGGMGVVLRGRDGDLGRDVAVKMLLEEHSGRPELVQRFVEEAQIAGQLQHPGIVPVYELGQMNRLPFFSMKLVKGQTLAEQLAGRADARQDRDKFLSIFERVTQAVAYAHAHGVIHRDLKPANVMVGGFGEVLVMDWGVAKILPREGTSDGRQTPTTPMTVIHTARSGGGADSSSGTETSAGSVMGTPAYMAPEQARGEVDLVDERADVFGLGAILCEILTGLPPYTGTRAEVLRKSKTASLQQAEERLSACAADRELIELTRQCLAAEPWQRLRDAAAVASAVTGYLESVAQRLRQAEVSQAAEEARRIEAQATAEQERKARQAAENQAAAERHARRLTLLLVGVLIVVVTLVGSGWAWVRNQREHMNAQVARNQGLEVKRQALEDMSIADSRSTQTLMLILQKQEADPSARHVVKKVQLVQTLGRVVFADSPRARQAALENWHLLEDNLANPKTAWFPEFLDEHEENIDTIVSNLPSVSDKRKCLLALSKGLREAIQESDELAYLTPLLAMLPHWYAQAEKSAEKLAAAAAEGRPLDEVTHYANQFWKLYCCELVLVEQQGVEAAMVNFGRALERWGEVEGGKAPNDLHDSLQKGLADLQEACRRELKRRPVMPRPEK